MKSFRHVSLTAALLAASASTGAQAPATRAWDETFRALPQPANIRTYMQRLSARPHHVGSPYDKDNAEWILAKFKEFGWNAQIEQFEVLFPTPRERVLELVEPTKFTAKLGSAHPHGQAQGQSQCSTAWSRSRSPSRCGDRRRSRSLSNRNRR